MRTTDRERRDVVYDGPGGARCVVGIVVRRADGAVGVARSRADREFEGMPPDLRDLVRDALAVSAPSAPLRPVQSETVHLNALTTTALAVADDVVDEAEPGRSAGWMGALLGLTSDDCAAAIDVASSPDPAFAARVDGVLRKVEALRDAGRMDPGVAGRLLGGADGPSTTVRTVLGAILLLEPAREAMYRRVVEFVEADPGPPSPRADPRTRAGALAAMGLDARVGRDALGVPVLTLHERDGTLVAGFPVVGEDDLPVDPDAAVEEALQRRFDADGADGLTVPDRFDDMFREWAARTGPFASVPGFDPVHVLSSCTGRVGVYAALQTAGDDHSLRVAVFDGDEALVETVPDYAAAMDTASGRPWLPVEVVHGPAPSATLVAPGP